MIKKMTLKNFKGIGESEAEIELKPITLLFGPNSAGKSTIIQALHYAREIFGRRNFNSTQVKSGGNAINLGGFKGIVHNHDLTKTVSLKFDLDLKNTDLPGAQDISNHPRFKNLGSLSSTISDAWVNIEIGWLNELEIVEVISYEIGINNNLLAKIKLDNTNPNNRAAYLADLNFNNSISEFFDCEDGEELKYYKIYIEEKMESALPDFRSNKSLNFVFYSSELHSNENQDATDVIEHYEWLLSGYLDVMLAVGRLLLEELNKFTYIGPIREVPGRNFEPHFTDELDRWANGLAAWDAIYRNEASLEVINKWLKKLNIGYRLIFKKYYSKAQTKEDNTFRNALTDDFAELSKYSEELQASSRERNKDFELYIYKQILEIQRLLISKNSEELSKFINKFNQEISDEIKSATDQQMHLWGNICDEVYQVGEVLKNSLDGYVNETEDDSEFIKKLFLTEEEKDLKLEPFDIGIGVSQVLPILVAGIMHKIQILSIEQPELHIHPAIQVELADLFISEINKRDVTFLLETHSEHIMLRMLRRIEETTNKVTQNDEYKLRPAQINVIWFEPSRDGLKLTNLPIDETGEFKVNWPRGFFEERAGELFPDE